MMLTTTRLRATGQRLAGVSVLLLCLCCLAQAQAQAGAQAASRPLLDIVDIQGIRDNNWWVMVWWSACPVPVIKRR